DGLGKSPDEVESIVNDFRRPFDLSQAPLLRVGIVKTGSINALLMIDMHHTIYDGISLGILIREFMALYEGRQLPVIPLQYRDFAYWLHTRFASRRLRKQEEFWLEMFAGELPVLSLAHDFPRSGRRNFNSDVVGFSIVGEAAENIKRLCNQTDTTLFMVLNAIYALLLAKLASQEEVVIGSPAAGRKHADMSAVIGMFVNTLALKFEPTANKTFSQFLNQVKERTLAAFENQDYQFDDLVEKIMMGREFGRNPVFDVMFAMQNIEIPQLEIPGLKLKPHGGGTHTALFDIVLTAGEGDRSVREKGSTNTAASTDLFFTFEYACELFTRETIKRFSDYFRNIAATVTRDPAVEISQLDIMSQEERRQIVVEFNKAEADFPREQTISRLFADQVEKTPGKIAVTLLYGKNSYRAEPAPGSRNTSVSFTYKELADASASLAEFLRRQGAGKGSVTAFMAHRTIDTIAAILAILETGSAYLPIEPDYPQERIDYILADSNAAILLTSGDSLPENRGWEPSSTSAGHTLIPSTGRILTPPICGDSGIFSRLRAVLFEKSLHTVQPHMGSESHHAAYLIYTSGSSGRPKGVIVEHRNVIRLVKNTSYIRFQPHDRILQTGALAFDASTFEVWGSLLNGLTLYMTGAPSHGEVTPSDGGGVREIADADLLSSHIKGNCITVMFLTVSLFNHLAAQRPAIFSSLRVLFVGGDVLSPHFIQMVRKACPHIDLVSCYGPTENTTFSTTFPIEKEYDNSLPRWRGSIPIGKPITNSAAYVVDMQNRLLPLGVPGELLVGGEGVARGYLNNPELTHEKFPTASLDQNLSLIFTAQSAKKSVDHPSSKVWPFTSGSPSGQQLYRTGDRARWLASGDLEFLGRLDSQVKIRGFRIELGEIRHHLQEHQKVKEAEVLVREVNSEKFLVAYIVPIQEPQASQNAEANDDKVAVPQPEPHKEKAPRILDHDFSFLKDHLSHKLPDYMIPGRFIPVDHIPLTVHGKVDGKRLPLSGTPAVDYTAPRDKWEEALVQIWSDILGSEPEETGIHDDFFQSGGHSLNATLLVGRIRKQLDVEIPLSEVFRSATISLLAQYIKSQSKQTYSPMQAAEKREYYPLAPAQRRLYLLQQMDLGGTAYNMPTAVAMEGDLDTARFYAAMEKMVRRHESLRTYFFNLGETPCQGIVSIEEIKESADLGLRGGSPTMSGDHKVLPYVGSGTLCTDEPHVGPDSFGGDNAESLNSPDDYTKNLEEFVRPFDLSKAPLFRFELTRTGRSAYSLLLDMHHIISDGMSMSVFIKEFTTLYAGETLPPTVIQYKDYALWLQRESERLRVVEQEQYWLNIFPGTAPVLELPYDFERPALQRFEGAAIPFTLDAISSGALEEIAHQAGVTPFILILALFNILLSKLSTSEDIIVGTPTAGRRYTELEEVIGMFVNTLALRNQPGGEKTFAFFLDEVKERTLNSFENQEYPFEELVEKTTVGRDPGRNPLFDVMFDLQNIHMPHIEIPGLELKQLPLRFDIAKFDLSLSVAKSDDTFSFSMEYGTSLFKEETIHRFIGYFKNIIAGISMDARLADIDILGEQERQKVLFQFNQTQKDYPRDMTLHQLFQQQVQRTPDSIALLGGLAGTGFSGGFTYRALDEMSGLLSVFLREKGLEEGTVAAVAAERNCETLIAILAILKAGAAYLPIDLDFPGNRIAYILKDSNASLWVTATPSASSLPEGRAAELATICLLHPELQTLMQGHGGLRVDAPRNISGEYCAKDAYIIYTSGSTGRPKGVLIQHRGVLNMIRFQTAFFNLHQQDRMLLSASLCFDASVEQTWLAFASGAELVIVAKDTMMDQKVVREFIINRGITYLDTVPALLNTLEISDPAVFSHLKRVTTGGDVCPPGLAEKWAGKCRFVNEYGPTETTVMSTHYPVEYPVNTLRDFVPIGRPIANTVVLILDRHQKPVPIGVPGELHIGGHGTANGYLNNPELTAAKFVTLNADLLNDADMADQKNETYNFPFYKTGDRVCWLPDGNIRYFGRFDFQVQIRGFRVETGEIENRLLQHRDIDQAAVTAWKAPNDETYLCAYITSSKEISTREIQQYTADYLPFYMIPSHLVRMEEIPKNTSGKIDRKSLPKPQFKATASRIAPTNSIEAGLLDVWTDLLALEKDAIGIDDNFFQVGGHSLKATNLIERVHKQFNVRVPLTEIFLSPSIRQLASYIAASDSTTFSAIQPAPPMETYPLSSAQERLYVLQQMNPQQTAYNMPLGVKLEGTLDVDQLEEAFQVMVSRHESLRTAFVLKDGEPRQVISPLYTDETADISVPSHLIQRSYDQGTAKNVDQTSTTAPCDGANGWSPEGTPEEALESFVRPFDLSKAPLFRAGLLKISDTSHVLYVDMHHIISDGISCDVFIRELTTLYGGHILSPQSIDYKDYCWWQKENSQKLAKQEDYWLEMFPSQPPVLDLPYDFPRPAVRDFAGKHYYFRVNPQLRGALEELAQAEGVTLYMVLLSVVTILLAKLSGQEDIVVGSPIAGRRHADLRDIIGIFINTLAMRNFPLHSLPYLRFLETLKQRTLQAYENQDYPFETLVEKIAVQRDTGRQPLLDVILALQSDTDTQRPESAEKSGDLTVAPFDFEITTSKFDLGFLASHTSDVLSFTLEYRTSLFKESTIRRFRGYFETLLSAVCENPRCEIGNLELLTQAERADILISLDNTGPQFPTDTIHRLFSRQAAQNPEGIALELPVSHSEDTLMTYLELDNLSNRIARMLLEKGAQSGDIAAICLEQSVEMPAAALGALKAGCAYMPIDPDYPNDRQLYMLMDSGSKILITSTSVKSTKLESLNMPAEALHIIDIDAALHIPGNHDVTDSNSPGTPTAQLDHQANGESPAYIIYTSGSSGKPKGVMVGHRNVVRLFFSSKFQFDFNRRDVWTLFHSFSFDFSVWEMYGALLFGGKLIIVPRLLSRDTGAFLKLLEERRVTVLNQTPAAFYPLMEAEIHREGAPLALRYIIFGGEALSPGKLKHWAEKYPVPESLPEKESPAPRVRLINMYGITETTVHVTFKEITAKEIETDISNIGKPIPTLGMCVLDASLKQVPPGVPGELCVYGEGVAHGYLNRPELTAEKFIVPPAGPPRGQGIAFGGQGEAFPTPRGGALRAPMALRAVSGDRTVVFENSVVRLYRSGDLGRILPDGDLEHMGRIDRQVKIRGFRIELGEIQNCLLKHPQVKEAVVTSVYDEQRGPFLYACIVPVENESIEDVTTLRQFLSESLPDYMIPAQYCFIDSIPLTPHGKIDTAALPEPERSRPQLHSPFEAAENRLEKEIAAVWSEVLDLEEVGVTDNFFDLGGNSLDIVKVNGKLKKRLDADIPVIIMFECPTIRTLARSINQDKGTCETVQSIETTSQMGKDSGHVSRDSEARTGPAKVAIIGMAGRFPGSDSIETFWDNLKNGVESITFFSDRELKDAGVSDEFLDNPAFVKTNGALLEGKEYFDASFFEYTPQQAELLSPQVRLFHECAWEALENGGYAPGTTNDVIALFGGVSSGFHWELLSHLSGGMEVLGVLGGGVLTNKDQAVTQVSYKLNLKGPAVSVQTACSTSLVAVDMAVRSLLDGNCRMALAGGAAVDLHTQQGYLYREGMIQSPDGHCRAFDAAAAGMVGGEGAGMLLLKRLPDALADGDTIHALILGSAINNDGNRKVGYTAPSVQGQAEVIRSALDKAGVSPDSITYVETHGTATPLGDPVEIQGLTRAFNSQKRAYCRIGSVKTNIGHLDTASGVAGLLKIILSFKHRLLPPSLHFSTPNPGIDFQNTPFVVNSQLTAWKSPDSPLRAGISSFGIGGTNAHIILEEAPANESTAETSTRRIPLPSLLTLSAAGDDAIKQQALDLSNYLENTPGINLRDIAYTLQKGRKPFKHRRTLVCSENAEAVEKLAALSQKSGSTLCDTNQPPPLVFMFAGLGAQYVQMGRGLYETIPAFKKEMDRCFQLSAPLMKENLKDILFPDDYQSPDNIKGRESSEKISPVPAVQTKALGSPETLSQKGFFPPEAIQPAVFCVEYALAKLLIAWGLQPKALIGYSFGEYAAAAAAGVFSIEDGLKLVVGRSRLIASLAQGAMMSVPLEKDALLPLLVENVSLAVDNGESCIVSGSLDAIETFEKRMKNQSLFCLRIPARHALHSYMMEPIMEAFEKQVAQIPLKEPVIPIISNVTGDWVKAGEMTNPRYWVNHLRHTVRFHEGMQCAPIDNAVFIEIGPGREISTLAARYMGETPPGNGENAGGTVKPGGLIVNTLRHPREKTPDHKYLLHRLGRLWQRGVQVDWTALYPGEKRRRIPLPTYPFQRRRFWSQVEAYQSGRLNTGILTAADNSRMEFVEKSQTKREDWFHTPVWEQAVLPLNTAATTDKSLCMLVFEDPNGFAPPRGVGAPSHDETLTLIERLKEQYHLIHVRRGHTFSNPEPGIYTLDPTQSHHYETLFDTLRRLPKPGQSPAESEGHNSVMVPDRIFYMWGMRSENHLMENSGHPVDTQPPVMDNQPKVPTVSDALTLETFNQSIGNCLAGLLHILQAMGRADVSHTLHITAVTNNLYQVVGDEGKHPEQALLAGALKSIQLEYPNVFCHGIDIDSADFSSDGKRNRLTEMVVRELGAYPTQKSNDVETIAFRGPFRWQRFYKPMPLPEPDPGHLPLRERGVYVITGGFGGMGFTIAQYLAANYRACLVLLTRSQFPAKEEREAWINQHADDDETSRRIRIIQKMEAQGAEVMPLTADISDEQRMRQVAATVESTFGPVNGVIHTAGIIDYGGIIQRREMSSVDHILDSKARGLLILDSIYKAGQLDFFMIFSSIASVLTSFGQVGYVAGNSFLDAFAASKSQYPGKYSVINWSDWMDVGMAVKSIRKANENNPERAEEELKGLEPIAVTPAEGTDAFLRILAQGLPRVMVLIQPLPLMEEFHYRYVTGAGEPVRETDQIGEQLQHPRPELAVEYRAAGSDMEKQIADMLQGYLGIDRVGVDDNFFDLGLSSLDIIQVNNRLKEQLETDIPLVTMFSYPTIADFSQHLLQEAAPESGNIREDSEDAPEEESQSEDLLFGALDMFDI
ncbi:MAG: amino acid adenylation domain-containing protein, partial [bacterium]|nr:amino acid adenylation domain-containing protein [bacterium]